MSARRYRKVGYVLAEQATEPGKVQTPEGVMSYEAGDYLVTDVPPTHIWPVKREVFERTYVLTDTTGYATIRREFEEYGDVLQRAGLRSPESDR